MKVVKELFNFEDHFFALASQKSTQLLKGPDAVEALETATGKSFPEHITSNFGVLIGEIHALDKAHTLFEKSTGEIKDDFKELLKSKTFDEFIDNFRDLVEVEELKKLPDVAKDIIHMQTGLVLSFGVVVKNYKGFNSELYKDSFNRYFFSEKGYITVSGDCVSRPKLPKNEGEKSSIKSIGNQINAERYLRDMIRIAVETCGDGLYNTKARYGRLKEKYEKEYEKKKLVDWFDSFGDMAEASLLPAVEEILNGAFSVELNPLIAASIGTFCSVTARKATEHSYLTLLGVGLKDGDKN